MSHHATVCQHCGEENHHHGTDCVKCRGSLAQAPGSAAAWKKFYDAALAEHERLARKYHEAGDTHGWNFHKGVASGLIKADIYMQQNAAPEPRGK